LPTKINAAMIAIDHMEVRCVCINASLFLGGTAARHLNLSEPMARLPRYSRQISDASVTGGLAASIIAFGERSWAGRGHLLGNCAAKELTRIQNCPSEPPRDVPNYCRDRQNELQVGVVRGHASVSPIRTTQMCDGVGPRGECP